MKKQNHKSAIDARNELTANGFATIHTPPGFARVWKRKGDKRLYCVAREKRARVAKFHIIQFDRLADVPSTKFGEL